jgi:hypothetical protein
MEKKELKRVELHYLTDKPKGRIISEYRHDVGSFHQDYGRYYYDIRLENGLLLRDISEEEIVILN